jgi:ABC-type antimicrobial peptide transport system permease subunit
VGFTSGAVIGFFLGFAFGVGCALAVMYSIYMGGYRTAVKEMQMHPPPERLSQAIRRAQVDR